MSKLGGRHSWKKYRLADHLDLGGERYTVDLVARKGTGVQGYRVTVVFLPRAAGTEQEIELPNARNTADVHRRVRELSEDPTRMEALFREAVRADSP